ncbi:MAG TPA: carboxypeptidase M32 [Candidatus Gemmiger excrementavium]|uniref:Metal-dependent carboxypeptidase n=1 Tax=Candidatus Gemmiger excrementavium TaxID=2838608 RepID=A0A9D2F1F6_9FIRM|nr:carboxypeptidase M32 [Candidatus Gemmiger excrementavium]
MKESIMRLRALEKQLFAYRYALNAIDFDAETVAPAGGADGRAEACEVLSRASFDLLVNEDTAALLRQAAAEAEDEQQAAEVRALQRQYDEIARIPAAEYAAFTKLVQQSVPVWTKAKRTNDFALFAPYLEKIVEARRAQARYFAPDRDPYEVWLDRYERGLTIAQCDEFFATLRAAIVPLLAAIRERGAAIRTDFLDQEWPLDAQKQVSAKILELWGLEPDHCLLAESEHPFTTEFWREDVRLTTHYMPRDMFSNLYSVAHEGGHALYERHIDPALDYTAVTGGATMGLHESQSRLFENYVGRSRAFVHCLYPTLRQLFPAQLADVTEEEVWRAVNRAEPGLIRTEADELTYALHIMVRYELEKAMIQGTLAVADLPAAWNAKYKEYLGVEVPDDARGCLQDIHWAMGDMGYFPSYALGSAYGAQAVADLRKTMDLDAQWEKGDLQPLKDALCARLWRYGSSKEPAWLVQSLCGGNFDPRYFTDYLTEKYTALYRL